MTASAAAAPSLREFGEDIGEFASLLSYPETRRAAATRAGDQALLAHLHAAACRDGVTIGDLDASTLLRAVDAAEETPSWVLAGDDGQDLLGRLDAHFAPRLVGAAERREERERRRESRARQAAERRLDEIRGWVGFQRRAVEEARARLAAMEAELEAEAARLGVPAWPTAPATAIEAEPVSDDDPVVPE